MARCRRCKTVHATEAIGSIVTAHGLLIYCSSSLRWCIGNDTITNYFILVHSECGDLYKLPRSPLRASSSPSCAATALPLPRSATQLQEWFPLLRRPSNHCFSNHCFANHCFSQFQGIGEDR